MTLGQWWQLGLLMSVVNIAIWMLVGGCGSICWATGDARRPDPRRRAGRAVRRPGRRGDRGTGGAGLEGPSRALALGRGGGAPAYEDATGTLRVHIASLRKKLEANPARPRIIVTEPGIGYRLQVD